MSDKGSAVYTNRFFINPVGGAIRIIFTEQNGPEDTPDYRAGVIMSPDDAIALSDLLAQLLKKKKTRMPKVTV